MADDLIICCASSYFQLDFFVFPEVIIFPLKTNFVIKYLYE